MYLDFAQVSCDRAWTLMSPERDMSDTGKEKIDEDLLLSDDDSVYNEEYMEEYDEDVDMDADGFEEGESDDFDADALSYDDDEIEGDNDGLVEEHPFEHDAPPQAALLDFDAPQESPYSALEPLSLNDILPPGTKRKARPDFSSASSLVKN